MKYEQIGDRVELKDDDEEVSLFERHYFEEGVKHIHYLTISGSGVKRKWVSKKDPELLTDEERCRVLDYCLGQGNYAENEIVNYWDLFMQGEFIEEIKDYHGK